MPGKPIIKKFNLLNAVSPVKLFKPAVNTTIIQFGFFLFYLLHLFLIRASVINLL